MSDLLSGKVGSKFAFLAFFFSLFLLFTPFEDGATRSMFPKYFSAGASIFLLAPLLAIKRIAFRTPSALVLVAFFAIIFHAVVIVPVPGQLALLIFANGFLAVLLYETSFNWRDEFVSAVSLLLIVHAVAIGVQALLFYVFLYGIFDFHKVIFGSDSRFAEDFLNIARFSGMQIEPGTYANYMACLLAILILSANFSGRIAWIAFFSVISIFLTNSGSSVYFAPVLMAQLAFLWREKIRPIHILILATAIVGYLTFSGVLTHLEDRFLERDDGSLSHRIEGIDAYLALSWEEKFIGIGFDRDPCVRCYYQDIGVLFNLVTRGGSIVALAISMLLFRSITVNGMLLSTILFLIPLNEKMYFYESPIWTFILFAITGFSNFKPSQAVRERPGELTLASCR